MAKPNSNTQTNTNTPAAQAAQAATPATSNPQAAVWQPPMAKAGGHRGRAAQPVPVLAVSTVANPVQVAWATFGTLAASLQVPGQPPVLPTRQALVAAGVNAGVATNTSRTQAQHWLAAAKVSMAQAQAAPSTQAA